MMWASPLYCFFFFLQVYSLSMAKSPVLDLQYLCFDISWSTNLSTYSLGMSSTVSYLLYPTPSNDQFLYFLPPLVFFYFQVPCIVAYTPLYKHLWFYLEALDNLGLEISLRSFISILFSSNCQAGFASRAFGDNFSMWKRPEEQSQTYASVQFVFWSTL